MSSENMTLEPHVLNPEEMQEMLLALKVKKNCPAWISTLSSQVISIYNAGKELNWR